ncbi:glycosyltransferase family 25 protein [Shewanella sp. 30m-9]
MTKKRKGYTLLLSEIACYISHYLLWEKCVELNELVDDFMRILGYTVSNLSA